MDIEEIVLDHEQIDIFKTDEPSDKYLFGFEGFGCDVSFLMGNYEIPFYDHTIACNLYYSNIYDIKLVVQPHSGTENWGVLLAWTTDHSQYEEEQYLLDVDKDIDYKINSPNENKRKRRQAKKIKQIIKELANKDFLANRSDEKMVIQILQKHYNNI